MYLNKKALIINITVIIIILFVTYMQVTLYIPFKRAVKTEKMVETTSKMEIINLNNSIDFNGVDMKVILHNVFNDLKISRNFFTSKSQISLPNYVLNFKYIDNDNKEITNKITVYNNSNMDINGEMFKISNNIYNDITKIITVGN